MQGSGNTAGQHSYDAGEIITRHALELALAISLVWHLFWLFSVKISVSAPGVPARPESAVSFVGAILEEGPVSPATGSDVSVQDDSMARLQDLVVRPETGANNGTVKLANVSDPDILKEIGAKSSADAAIGIKQMPEKPFDEIKVSYKTYPAEIEGPARFREVMYKPELPVSLRWDESLGVDFDRLGNTFSVALKFLVSPEGKVESVERLSSSGHPTVDIIAIRYLKEWQFAPLKSGNPKEKQWGTVKLDFSLNKAGVK